MAQLILESGANKEDPVGMEKLWNKVKDRMFDLTTRQQQMGLGEQVRETKSHEQISLLFYLF